MHELGILKMERKAHIFACKDGGGMSLAEIAKQLLRHRLSIDRLVVKDKVYPRRITTLCSGSENG
jgi:IS30 family transposase